MNLIRNHEYATYLHILIPQEVSFQSGLICRVYVSKIVHELLLD